MLLSTESHEIFNKLIKQYNRGIIKASEAFNKTIDTLSYNDSHKICELTEILDKFQSELESEQIQDSITGTYDRKNAIECWKSLQDIINS